MVSRPPSLTLPLPLRVRSAAAGRLAARPRPRAPRPRTVLALVALVVAVGGGWWWLRDSSVVGVTEVTITGIHGTQAGTIRAALTAAARDMTTLDVSQGRLRRAVARYPIVADVRAVGHFPHRLSITVIARTPVAALHGAGRTTAVADDGTLLPATSTSGLATVAVRALSAGTRLRDPLASAQVRILAAAPAALRRQVSSAFTGSRGLELQLRNGPVLAFGAPVRLAAKWAALTAVLADPASAGGTVIDLSVPERPAVAGLAPLAQTPALDASGSPIPDPTATGSAPSTGAGSGPSTTSTTPAVAPTPTPAAPVQTAPTP